MVSFKNKSAFTLIELLIVVIIVAVLAGVGVPLLRGNVDRARASEADAGLGTIRTALRAYLAEHNTYATATMNNIGLNANDLLGRYFDDSDYSLNGLTGTSYCIQVNGGQDPDTAPQAADVTGVVRSMNETGTISNTACPS